MRGPVSRMRNSSLSVDEHRRYLALERKLRRFQENADDSRPLTAEESAALDRLTRLVVAEQARPPPPDAALPGRWAALTDD